MKFFKWHTAILLALIVLVTACADDEGAGETDTYQPQDFELTLPNTEGEQISVVPNGKTLYLYFTGVG